METKYLVITCGFFGDIIFASSIAKKLKEQELECSVDYLIGFPQIKRLIQNNPYINKVFVSDYPSPNPINNSIDYSIYKIIQLKPLNYQVTPCEEYQIFSGIQNLSPEYVVYTEPQYDEVAKKYCTNLRNEYQKKVIAVMTNWEPKTYVFTKQQYIDGVDVPNLGYGGKHRNINYITSELEKIFNVIYVGYPQEYNQSATSKVEDNNQKSILFESSLIKYCDAFIGTDGGLATIAGGVGTKTIITGDFNLQLYGWNGVLKKIKNPRLGPYEYFGDPHVVLDPYFTDEEVLENIIKNI